MSGGSSTVTDSEFGDGVSNIGSVIAINEPSSTVGGDESRPPQDASRGRGTSNRAFSCSDEHLDEVCIGASSPPSPATWVDQTAAIHSQSLNNTQL